MRWVVLFVAALALYTADTGGSPGSVLLVLVLAAAAVAAVRVADRR